MIRADAGVSFDNGPYSITATVGYSAASDYATRIEPVISAAIIDMVAELFKHRNPGVEYLSSGGSVAETYSRTDIPRRTRLDLDTIRPVALG